MSTRELVDAIITGDAASIQTQFETAMAQRIAERLDTMRVDVARNMFGEACSTKKSMKEQEDEIEPAEPDDEDDMREAVEPGAAKPAKPAKVGDNHIHVQHVGGGKYKVHAVGKNFAGDEDGGGIKVGEHLSDSDLDDFQEMGGKIKHVK